MKPITRSEAARAAAILGFSYIAMDMNGKWFAYDNKPYLNIKNCIWSYLSNCEAIILLPTPIKYRGKWENSLIKGKA
jgi:hypothetical protein